MKRILAVLILFLGAFLFWRYQQKGAILDDAELSGRFEAEVNDVLSANGLDDSDVLSVSHTERRAAWPIPSSWVETEREIRVRNPKIAQRIVEQVRNAASRMGLASISETQGDHETVVECGKGKRVFQRLIFLSGGQAQPKRRREGKKVAIVIDDIAGRLTDLEKMDEFISLRIPMTFAVLPMEKQSKPVSEKIQAAELEVILHQPMEPEDMAHNNPGKAAFLISMKAPEIRKKLELNLETVPHARGFSNHMGSRFTSDARSMDQLLSTVKGLNQGAKRKVFFLDSHTTPKMVSGRIAARYGVPYLANDVFLDNKDDYAAMRAQLKLVKKEAEKKGYAICIGHIQRKHIIQALRDTIPEFRKEGIEFVTLSQLLPAASNASAQKKKL